MNAVLASLLRAEGGVVSRSAALRLVPQHVVEHAVRAGHVRPMFAGMLLAPDVARNRLARWRAAVLRAGPDAALSHLSALEVWGLRVPLRDEVHVPRRGPGACEWPASLPTADVASRPWRRWSWCARTCP